MTIRNTSQTVFLLDSHIEQPAYGTSVIGTTIGNKLCETIWTRDSILYFDTWGLYPKIPHSVKVRQLERLQRGEWMR